MIAAADLKPLQRQALLAMRASPTHALRRAGRAYVAFGGAQPATSGTHTFPAFTGRLVNMLERDGLVDFHPPVFPERVTLNLHGQALAEQLATAGEQ